MSGRGLSRWTNRGQAWANADGMFGGWLNVDGQQRRVRIHTEPDGSLGIAISALRVTPEHTDVFPREQMPERASTEKEARLRKIAESDVTAKYGPRAFGRKP